LTDPPQGLLCIGSRRLTVEAFEAEVLAAYADADPETGSRAVVRNVLSVP
jgi:hypothetical protein